MEIIFTGTVFARELLKFLQIASIIGAAHTKKHTVNHCRKNSKRNKKGGKIEYQSRRMMRIATVAILLTLVAVSLVSAQTVVVNSKLIDGSSATENVCYTSAADKNSVKQVSGEISSQGTAANVPLLLLGDAPKVTIHCLDLIEKMGVTLASVAAQAQCVNKASISLCSGKQGSAMADHATCQPITTFYTAPKTDVTGGTINGETLSWSIRYDGSSYNNFCFPRTVQVILSVSFYTAQTGSVVVLIVAVLLAVVVLCMASSYGCYIMTRWRSARAAFAQATAVLPNANPPIDAGDYDDDTRAAEQEERRARGENIDDLITDEDGVPRPPLRSPSGGGGDDDDFFARHGFSSPRKFVVNDGAKIFEAGPIASIYGEDVREDALSIGRAGRSQQQQQQQQDAVARGVISPGSPATRGYRILPDVNVAAVRNQQQQQHVQEEQQRQQNPLPPPQTAPPVTGAVSVSIPARSTAKYTNPYVLSTSPSVTVDEDTCPDCGKSRNSVATCEVTGMHH